MRAYVYEPRQQRQASLTEELERVDIKPYFVDERFFGESKSQLTQQVDYSDPILIGEAENTPSLIRSVRQHGLNSPLIVMRDFRNTRDASAALDQGADDVIVQPIRGPELLSRIKSIIRRAHGHSSESVIVGELVAYFDGRDPTVSGESIRLSKREHAIFVQLALNSNRVVSKNAIYDAVYGASPDQPFDKVIDVYICKLRKKFSEAALSGHQYIETIRGRGYRLGAPPDWKQDAQGKSTSIKIA